MTSIESRVGFMQGRLCNIVDSKIQAFPWQDWEQEFNLAKTIGLQVMEWTLDYPNLQKNPLLTLEGQSKINQLRSQHSILIPSLTGDCFMQKPFWKSSGVARFSLEQDFIAIAKASESIGITYIVVPLVDGGRVESRHDEAKLFSFLEKNSKFFFEHKLKIIFESDFPPEELSRFIKRLDPDIFGINYDIGNSASLGFDVVEEFEAYGDRILNVHVKDRLLGGMTVPLGQGNANFYAVFNCLSKNRYQGNFILQTARAKDGEHLEVMAQYLNMTMNWIEDFSLDIHES